MESKPKPLRRWFKFHHWPRRYAKRTAILAPVIVIIILALGGGGYALFLASFGAPAATNSSVNLDKGLVGEWKMNGNLKDSTPYGDDGIASNISIVQGPITGSAGNQTSVSAAWPAATTAGDALVAIVSINNGYSTPTAPSGWTTRSGSAGWGTSVYEIINSASRSGTETFNFDGGNDASVWLFELSGVSSTTPDDVTSSYSGAGGSTSTLGPKSLGSNAGIAFAVADTDDGCDTGYSWSTTAAGWEQSSGYRSKLAYDLVNGSQSVAATTSAPCSWKGLIFSFNSASSPGISLTTDRKGQTNEAYSFNGSSSRISALTNNLPGTNDAQSLSIWFYPTSSAGKQSLISLLGDGIGNQIVLNSGLLRMEEYGGTGTNGPSVSLNTWHLATYTYDGTDCKLYLDDIQVASATSCAQAGASDAIMFGSDTSGDWFNGKLDDARIYNRAINTNEVKALYNTYNDPLDIASGEKGLIGWWKFDGNYNDSTPYQNNCSPSGSGLDFAADREGHADSALSDIISNRYLNCGSPAIYDLSTLSISAWAYPTQYQQGANNGDGILSATSYWFNFNPLGQLEFAIVDAGYTQHILTTAASYPINNWYHVTATYDGSTMKIYVNGVMAASQSYSGGMASSGGLRLGCYYTSPSSGRTFVGYLDDIKVYNRALGVDEIDNLYNEYDSHIQISDLQKGLVGYWPMNGSAKDATPHSNNGAVNGATLATDRYGHTNSAYDFNGTSDYIDLDPAPIGTPASVTVAAWIKLDALKADKNTIVTDSDVEFTDGWTLFVESDDTLDFGVSQNTSTKATASSTATLSSGIWYFVVGSYDSATDDVAVYLNGQASSPVSFPNNIDYDSNRELWIGKQHKSASQSTRYFHGSIDDIRIYNRALSAAEVQALYNLPD